MNKKNIKYIIKIILLIIAICYSLDKLVFFSLNKISDRVFTGQAIGKLNHFLVVKDTTDILVFGHSRVNRHVDVSKLSKSAFNIGIDGTNYAYYATLIQTLPKERKQTVIIHIDAKTLFDSNYKGEDITSLKTKYKRNPVITQALKQSGEINPIQNVLYSINYNGNILGILANYVKPKYNYKTYNGYDPLVLSDEQKRIRSELLGNLERESCSESLLTNKLIVSYLKKIKVYCIENNKKLVAITTPVFKDDCPEDDILLKKLMKTLEIMYLDYSNLFSSNKSIELWKDRTHLTKYGARLFTEELSNDLINLNVITK